MVAATGAAMTLMGCNECPTSEVVASKAATVDASVACASVTTGLDCKAICGGGYNSCSVRDDAFLKAWYGAPESNPQFVCPQDYSAQVNVSCQQIERDTELTFDGCVVDGRRPDGLATFSSNNDSALRSYLAEVTFLEAASVIAFEHIAADLARFGAPKELLDWALRARDDERRHTNAAAGLAKRFGAALVAPEVLTAENRSLFALALENAVEGEVRETYGAALALHRADCAGDDDMRAHLRNIAADECDHAAFSHALAKWIAPRLTRIERVMLEEARERAIETLLEELAIEPSFDIRQIAGVPSATVAQKMARALFAGEMNLAA